MKVSYEEIGLVHIEDDVYSYQGTRVQIESDLPLKKVVEIIAATMLKTGHAAGVNAAKPRF